MVKLVMLLKLNFAGHNVIFKNSFGAVSHPVICDSPGKVIFANISANGFSSPLTVITNKTITLQARDQCLMLAKCPSEKRSERSNNDPVLYGSIEHNQIESGGMPVIFSV